MNTFSCIIVQLHDYLTFLFYFIIIYILLKLDSLALTLSYLNLVWDGTAEAGPYLKQRFKKL